MMAEPWPGHGKRREHMAADNGQSGMMVGPPKGMVRVGSVSNAPWFELANGNRLYGKLINIFERPDERAKLKRSKFYQVELLAPCQVRRGRGREAEIDTAEVGEVVNLNHGPKTKDFEPLIEQVMRGAQFNVYVGVTGEKFDIGKGQTMWPLDCRMEMVRPQQVSDDEPDFQGDEGGEASAAAAG